MIAVTSPRRVTMAFLTLLAGVTLLAPTVARATHRLHPYTPWGSTVLVSQGKDGVSGAGGGTGGIGAPAVSADGRYVAFTSTATNLVPGDTNQAADVFRRDTAIGRTNRVSVGSNGAQANGPVIGSPAMTPDGRYIAFASTASNLVRGDTNGVPDVFVRDMMTGKTTRVSVTSHGGQANGESLSPAISSAGRFIVFTSLATNLVAGDTNGAADVFEHDLVTGATIRVSVANRTNAQANAQFGGSGAPAVSADGRYVAFASFATNLVVGMPPSCVEPGDSNYCSEIYLRDVRSLRTIWVSAPYGSGQRLGSSDLPRMSGNGRYVAFISDSRNLVPADTSTTGEDAYVYDTIRRTTTRVSVSSAGVEGADANLGTAGAPSISADGRFVAFASDADNLVDGDTNGAPDVFVHDLYTAETRRVSVGPNGSQAFDPSPPDANPPTASALCGGLPLPGISATGRFIAFDSAMDGLVEDTPNHCDTGYMETYVHDQGPAVDPAAVVATRGRAKVAVSGWLGLSGTVLESRSDPIGDAKIANTDLSLSGADITNASITYRVDLADLLLRLTASTIPGPAVGGAPQILYRWRLRVGQKQVAYEVRASRVDVTAPPAPPGLPPPPQILPLSPPTIPGIPSVPPLYRGYFALLNCSHPVCLQAAWLTGSIGTVGSQVWVSLPLALIGATEGTALRGLSAETWAGDAADGGSARIDGVSLPAAIAVPAVRVEVGIAMPGSRQPHDISFAPAEEGEFSVTLPGASLARASQLVGRACIGENMCGPLLALATSR